MRNESSERAITVESGESVIQTICGTIIGGDPSERWREIPGFDGIYMISDTGRVISKARGRWKFLSPTTSQDGYKMLSLRSGKGAERKGLCRALHCLLLTTFVGPRPEGMQGCHNNGVRTDNRLCNLRWDTPSANQQDRRLHGTFIEGADHWWNTKLSKRDVFAIKVLLEKGVFQHTIAKIFGVSQAHISLISRGEKWASVSTESDIEDYASI